MAKTTPFEELEKQYRALEAKLVATEKDNEEFHRLFSMTLDLICIADIHENNYVRINDAFSRLLGYSREEILARTYHDFLHPDDIEPTNQLICEQQSRNKDTIHFENRYRCKNGTYKWLSWVAYTSEADGLTYAVARDVAEQKEISRKIEEQNRLMNTLLDNLQVGVFMISAPSGRPLLANRRAKEVLGRGIMPDADRNNLSETYKAYKVDTREIYPTEQLPIVRGLRGETSYIDDMVVIQPNGDEVYVEVFGSPVLDSEGNVSASIISFSDITERRTNEVEREKLIDELQSAIENIKTLNGLLPICSVCKKIRDDKGYWNELEAYISDHSDASFSHGICTECSDKIYGNEEWYIKMKERENKPPQQE